MIRKYLHSGLFIKDVTQTIFDPTIYLGGSFPEITVTTSKNRIKTDSLLKAYSLARHHPEDIWFNDEARQLLYEHLPEMLDWAWDLTSLQKRLELLRDKYSILPDKARASNMHTNIGKALRNFLNSDYTKTGAKIIGALTGTGLLSKGVEAIPSLLSKVLPWMPAINTAFAVEGALHLTSNNGILKTWNLSKKAYNNPNANNIWNATKSGLGDLLDTSMLLGGVGELVLAGPKIIDTAKRGWDYYTVYRPKSNFFYKDDSIIPYEIRKLLTKLPKEERQEFLANFLKLLRREVEAIDLLNGQAYVNARTKAREEAQMPFQASISAPSIEEINDYVGKKVLDIYDEPTSLSVTFTLPEIFGGTTYTGNPVVHRIHTNVILEDKTPKIEVSNDNYGGYDIIFPTYGTSNAKTFSNFGDYSNLTKGHQDYADKIAKVIGDDGMLGGSTLVYARTKTPGVAKDSEFYTTLSRLPALTLKLKIQSLNPNSNGTAYQGTSPYAINGNVDINVIYESNGAAVGLLAHLKYMYLFPDKYRNLMKQWEGDEIPIYSHELPISAEDLYKLLGKDNNLLGSIMADMYKSNKDKHRIRSIYSILNADDLQAQAITQMHRDIGRSWIPNYKTALAFNIDYGNVEANKEFLKALGISDETLLLLIASNPYKMEALCEKFNLENLYGRAVNRLPGQSLSDVRRSLSFNTMFNGGDYSGGGGNTLYSTGGAERVDYGNYNIYRMLMLKDYSKLGILPKETTQSFYNKLYGQFDIIDNWNNPVPSNLTAIFNKYVDTPKSFSNMRDFSEAIVDFRRTHGITKALALNLELADAGFLGTGTAGYGRTYFGNFDLGANSSSLSMGNEMPFEASGALISKALKSLLYEETGFRLPKYMYSEDLEKAMESIFKNKNASSKDLLLNSGFTEKLLIDLNKLIKNHATNKAAATKKYKSITPSLFNYRELEKANDFDFDYIARYYLRNNAPIFSKQNLLNHPELLSYLLLGGIGGLFGAAIKYHKPYDATTIELIENILHPYYDPNIEYYKGKKYLTIKDNVIELPQHELRQK